MNTPENKSKELSPTELDAVLQQARDEGWSSLSLVSPWGTEIDSIMKELPPDHAFVVSGLSKQATLDLRN